MRKAIRWMARFIFVSAIGFPFVGWVEQQVKSDEIGHLVIMVVVFILLYLSVDILTDPAWRED